MTTVPDPGEPTPAPVPPPTPAEPPAPAGVWATPQPGEALPAARRLSRPPGDRFRPAVPEVILERPDITRALLLGLGAAAGTMVVTGILHAILSITAGMIAISVLGGWLIGIGVRTGAWSGRPHRPSRVPGALAVGLGLGAWVGGMLLAWLLSQAILPGSSRPFLDRLSATPFLDWLVPQLGPLDLLRAVLLVGVAWVTAQTARLERRDPAPGA